MGARTVKDIDMRLWLLTVSVVIVERTSQVCLQAGFVLQRTSA